MRLTRTYLTILVIVIFRSKLFYISPIGISLAHHFTIFNFKVFNIFLCHSVTTDHVNFHVSYRVMKCQKIFINKITFVSSMFNSCPVRVTLWSNIFILLTMDTTWYNTFTVRLLLRDLSENTSTSPSFFIERG